MYTNVPNHQPVSHFRILFEGDNKKYHTFWTNYGSIEDLTNPCSSVLNAAWRSRFGCHEGLAVNGGCLKMKYRTIGNMMMNCRILEYPNFQTNPGMISGAFQSGQYQLKWSSNG